MPGPNYLVEISRLCEAQNWRCAYCGIYMHVGIHRPQWDHATREHVIPRVAGGTDDWDNLVAACKLCNNGRSAMKAKKYLQFVRWKGREKAAKYANRLRKKILLRQHIIKTAAIRAALYPNGTSAGASIDSMDAISRPSVCKVAD